MAKFTNLQQVAFAEKALAQGWKYWYGTYGNLASTALYNSKKKQYPSHYTSARASTYKKHISEKRRVVDCVGLIKAFFWTGNGANEPKYGSNSCPDTNANGMINRCKKTGSISTIPNTPGLVVWSSGHIGISLDGVYAIEARGFNYGVVKTKIRGRSWTKWGQLPASMIDYVSEASTAPDSPASPDAPGDSSVMCPYQEPTKNQKKGMKGEGVRWVQWMLEHCGFSVGSCGIDGDFGADTRSATRKFQRKWKLEIDGIVGIKTRAALKGVFEGRAKTEPPAIEPTGYVPKGKIADLSKWQGSIDWTAAARELDFCILRAQYGDEKIDERYKEYAAGCEAMGIPYGAYSYCLFNDVETAIEEAHFFVQRIADTHPSFLVLDVEPGGVIAKDVRKMVSAYISELHGLGYKRIGLYIAHHTYDSYNIDTSEADFVWIPRYGSNSGDPERKPDYPCDLWQYTSNGKLAGVKGRVDLNKLMDESRMAWFRGEV